MRTAPASPSARAMTSSSSSVRLGMDPHDGRRHARTGHTCRRFSTRAATTPDDDASRDRMHRGLSPRTTRRERTRSPPYAGFGGTDGPGVRDPRNRRGPSRPRRRDGAPNIVVMLCDDLGYSRPRLLRLRDPHAEHRPPRRRRTALHGLPLDPDVFADARALLTGLEPPSRRHAATLALRHRRSRATRCSSTPFAPTLPEMLRRRGYTRPSWSASGTSREDSDVNAAGDRSSWPLQKGFDRYYGFIGRVHEPAPAASLDRGQPRRATSTSTPRATYFNGRPHRPGHRP